MPTTITIKEDTKELLKSLKGEKDWDSFLKDLAREHLKAKREESRKKLKKLLISEFKDVKVKRWAREY
ncbi:MAG: hypothetical protein H0Z28_07250 [Archaeoglobus sp.]|nr:hypothetical protein [Archaeoglobus sp.]